MTPALERARTTFLFRSTEAAWSIRTNLAFSFRKNGMNNAPFNSSRPLVPSQSVSEVDPGLRVILLYIRSCREELLLPSIFVT
jgi:hypothetical protein